MSNEPYRYRNGEVWAGPSERDQQIAKVKKVAESLPPPKKAPSPRASSARARGKNRLVAAARRGRERREAEALAAAEAEAVRRGYV